MITIKSSEEIAAIAEGGKILADVLAELKLAAVAGVTTLFLDKLALNLIKKAGGKPAFLNYRPSGAKEAYPFTLCASVNDCVVHGQPSDYILRDGDVVKLDLGVRHKGFYTDSAVTAVVAKNINIRSSEDLIFTDDKKLELVRVTEQALYKGIAQAKPGKTVGDIGHAIEKHVISHKLSVVKSLVGHGIGRNLHEEPEVWNFGDPGTGAVLKEGMVIAIEPMVAMGSGETRTLKDDSFVTADGSLAAHWEHTVAITANGPVVLTK